MRLLRLKIKNIASLKGEHVVDFADIQKVSSLFAITGETGAGKSSILNCLGLALYGQIFKKSLIQTDVVTLGEKEGQIELIFEVKGKHYLAFWKAKVRKQNGELYSTPQSPTRDLYLLEGEDFSSPKNIASKKVDELLNLDFDQFCKCVILNQGEFAKFLTSSFTERKDILEKLYPGELLESLSRELKLQMDGFQKTRNDLDIKLQENKAEENHAEDLQAGLESAQSSLKSEELWLHHAENLQKHFESLRVYHSKHQESEGKILSMAREISEQTTTRNSNLTEAQVAQELHQAAQKNEEVLSPRLLSLLQLEETALGLKKNLSSTEKKFADIFTAINLQTTSRDSSLEKKVLWGKTHETLASQLGLPFEKLSEVASDLEALLEKLQEFQVLQADLKGQRERLSEAEIQGKDLAQKLSEADAKIKAFPEDITLKLQSLEARKKEVKASEDLRARQEIQLQEVQKNIEGLELEKGTLSSRAKSLSELSLKLEQDLLPLQTTLSMSELIVAREICLESAHERCPVCETAVPEDRWLKLKENLGKTDLALVKKNFEDGSRRKIKSDEELHQVTLQLSLNGEKFRSKTEEAQTLTKNRVAPQDFQTLESEISVLQKQSWDLSTSQEDRKKIELDLTRARENFKKLKSALTSVEEKVTALQSRISEDQKFLTDLFPKELTADDVPKIKGELRTFRQLQESAAVGQKIQQDLSYLEKDLQKMTLEKASLSEDLESLKNQVKTIDETLRTELSGQSASTVLANLRAQSKSTQEKWATLEQVLKKQDLLLKDLQGRLTQIEELKKDFDFQFTSELHQLKELAGIPLPPLRDSFTQLKEVLRNLNLDLKSSSDLFAPLRDRLLSEIQTGKAQTSDLRGQLGSLKARLEDFEKRQDKIKLMLLNRSEIQSQLDRLERLFEVLGKDEMRTFVLSLVEKNLIIETNQELQRLCQGRYEIVHQSRSMRMSPDFYILDKYREGGLRKVSTLSGGETFMVSLAMALALAEMTRGQAEIDSLFIDEGFGTLDQDSLEDVLEMLNQIQTRGLMVGIISHIKPLTNSLPVNLVLHKKQDGTSTMSLQYN